MAIQNREQFLDIIAQMKQGAAKNITGKSSLVGEISKTVTTSFANAASTITSSIYFYKD